MNVKKDSRIQFGFTLSKELGENFNKFCEEKNINKSRLLEWMIVQYLDKEEL